MTAARTPSDLSEREYLDALTVALDAREERRAGRAGHLRPVEEPHPTAAAALLPEYTIRRLDRGSHRFGLYRDEILVDAFAKSSNAESMLALLRGEIVDGHEGPRSRVYATAVVEFDETRRRYVRAGIRPVSPPESLAERADRLAAVARARTRSAAEAREPSAVDLALRTARALIADSDRNPAGALIALRALVAALDEAGIGSAD